METKLLSIQKKRSGSTEVLVEHPQGGVFVVGFNGALPLVYQKEFSQAICTITDNFIKLEKDNYYNYVSQELLFNRFPMPLYAGQDRNTDRERIGHRIKELREEQNWDSKTLALKAGITPANMSRIEQGKYSPGLDILSRIASVLGMKLDFVKKGGEK